MVVLNREWIIGKMLNSLMKQRYPHDRIYVVIVDGESEDRTVEIIKNRLENSDFVGYDITVKRCSIPEGRNICIEKMKGEILVFWDSDVIANSNALKELVKMITQGKADIVHARTVNLFMDSIEEFEAMENAIIKNKQCEDVFEVSSVGMGFTAISKKGVRKSQL